MEPSGKYVRNCFKYASLRDVSEILSLNEWHLCKLRYLPGYVCTLQIGGAVSLFWEWDRGKFIGFRWDSLNELNTPRRQNEIHCLVEMLQAMCFIHKSGCQTLGSPHISCLEFTTCTRFSHCCRVTSILGSRIEKFSSDVRGFCFMLWCVGLQNVRKIEGQCWNCL